MAMDRESLQIEIPTNDGLKLLLRRCNDEGEPRPVPPQSRRMEQDARESFAKLEDRKRDTAGRRTPVLLLHGASACRETFLFPRAAGLAHFLLRYTNLQPWLLDWRGSHLVTDKYRKKPSAMPKVFSFDHAARDIPLALDELRAQYEDPDLRIPIVGHCMGAATLARAIAEGFLKDRLPSHIVLSTVGLFYEVAVDGRLKAEDHLLERLWSDDQTQLIDPRCSKAKGRRVFKPREPWPDDLETMYSTWPRWFKPHPGIAGEIAETCNRLSFMYGEPYYEPALNPDIHSSPEELKKQFGAIPLQMYLHAAQSVRRGWIAEFELEDGKINDDKFIGETARNYFDDIHITLITGALNRLWHRDSIDRMYEWLMRPPTERRNPESKGRRCEKIIFRNNGHQDLLWGQNSWYEVFPRIADGLTA
jgi:pimeloyl-ACP methyl ester carboxylesterase